MNQFDEYYEIRSPYTENQSTGNVSVPMAGLQKIDGERPFIVNACVNGQWIHCELPWDYVYYNAFLPKHKTVWGYNNYLNSIGHSGLNKYMLIPVKLIIEYIQAPTIAYIKYVDSKRKNPRLPETADYKAKVKAEKKAAKQKQKEQNYPQQYTLF